MFSGWWITVFFTFLPTTIRGLMDHCAGYDGFLPGPLCLTLPLMKSIHSCALGTVAVLLPLLLPPCV